MCQHACCSVCVTERVLQCVCYEESIAACVFWRVCCKKCVAKSVLQIAARCCLSSAIQYRNTISEACHYNIGGVWCSACGAVRVLHSAALSFFNTHIKHGLMCVAHVPISVLQRVCCRMCREALHLVALLLEYSVAGV